MLWKQRFQQFLTDIRKYIKYILNDHLKFVLLFALGAGAYYYQQWLETLSPSFPAALVMAVIVGLVITNSPTQTLLKRADLVFLLPMETKLRPYFKKAFAFSFIIQLYLLLLVIAALAPLYVKWSGGSYSTIFMFLLFFLGLKALNIGMSWWAVYFEEPMAKLTDFFVRLLLNGSFAYFLFVDAPLLFSVATAAIIIGLTSYYRALTAKKPLKWERLIELEEKRMGLFYRLANLFTDVPSVKERVKRRKYLDWLLTRIPFKQSATYDHLYKRTFLRTGDYLGLLVRLTVIGILLLMVTPFQYGNIVVVLLMVYATGFQTIPLWKHHRQTIWVSLYPIDETVSKKAFLSVLRQALFVQLTVFTVFLLFSNMTVAILSAVAGVAFIQVFISTYVQRKMS